MEYSYNQIQELKADNILVIDYWAEWCGPCKTLSPIIEELGQHYVDTNSTVIVGKCDVETLTDEEKKEIGLRSIPSVIIYKNGQELERLIGLRTLESLKKTISVYENS